MPAPDSNDHDPMQEALRRDAARISEPPFDPALHYAAMRRIRALADGGSKPSRFRPMPIFATAIAASIVAVFLATQPPHPSPKNAPREATHTAPPASLLAYQQAAAQGDDALFAQLDRDAQTLLPPSAPVFNTSLR